MTDRFNSFTVVLESDMREDDAQVLMNVICQLRGVLKVSGNVSNIETHIAYARARTDIQIKLWDALKE